MELHELPSLSGDDRLALENALTIQRTSEYIHEQRTVAVELCLPYARLAVEMVRSSIVLDDRSPLVKVGDNADNQPVYVYAAAQSRHRSTTTTSGVDGGNHCFVTCVGSTISSADYPRLSKQDKATLKALGRSTAGNTVYGIEVVREPLRAVFAGFSGLTTTEAADQRLIESRETLRKIQKTVDYIRTGILSDVLNPQGRGVFRHLLPLIEGEEAIV